MSLRHQVRLFTAILILCIFSGLPSYSVEPGKASWTAEYVASLRAIAAMDPDENIRNPDYMAARFISPEYWLTVPGLSLDYHSSKKTIERWRNAAYYYVNARTKHIDSLLNEAIRNGTTQVVILGAGYDSRAYRFAGKGLRFFEVDLPETQILKKKRIKEILGRIPQEVIYIPTDFNTQPLSVVLEKSGYDPEDITFFIWEGVTYYITEEGVDSTLKCIATSSAPGSSVIFDYVLRPVIEGDYRFYRSRIAAVVLADMGEPLTFGIADGDQERFMNASGLKVIEDVGSPELTRRYLKRSDDTYDGRMHEFFRLMHSGVTEAGERESLMSKAQNLRDVRPLSPEPPEVKPTGDVTEFLKEFARALESHDIERIMSHYSKNYYHEGQDREMERMNWEYLLAREPFKSLTRAEIVITYFEVTGGNARVIGFVRSNIGLDPLGMDPGKPTYITKERGKCLWLGNQEM